MASDQLPDFFFYQNEITPFKKNEMKYSMTNFYEFWLTVSVIRHGRYKQRK